MRSSSVQMQTGFSTRPVRRGRVLYVRPDGVLYAGDRCAIHRSDDDGQTWTTVTQMPRSSARRGAELFRLACRLLRHEVRAMVDLADGTCVAANRQGVYVAGPGEPVMNVCRIDDGGTPAMPPMCITLGPDGRVLWGEYGGNSQRGEVRLYVSDDGGRSFEVAHVFPAGEIRHVHNIVYDRREGHYWVLTGDFGKEAGIGRLSADLKNFDWFVRGDQQYRAVCLFDLGDHLLYGMDTELEPNAIMRLEKSSGRIERLVKIPGSCIYACRFGGLFAVATSVEPSQVNLGRASTLWLSRDGEDWAKVFQATKDRWNGKYFQYGSLVLPRGESDRETILLSGQALKGIDGRTMVGTLTSGVRE